MTPELEAPRRPVLLDMDVGIDDAVALCLAMRSPEIAVVGVSAVHGNVPVERTAANALRTLEFVGAEDLPPVSQGARSSLAGGNVHADDVHGRDGLGGAIAFTDPDGRLRYPEPKALIDGRSATALIHDIIEAHVGRLVLVATGPLTNVAEAIRKDPVHVRRLKGIIAMAGAFRCEGNMSAVAEFNVFADPEAARVVLEAGVPLTLIPLDVTESVVLDRDVVRRHADTRLGRFVSDISDAVMDFSERFEAIRGMYVHDALAVAYAVDGGLFRTLERFVQVETTSEVTMGKTVADLRQPARFGGRPNARVAMDVDADRFLTMLTDRVLGR